MQEIASICRMLFYMKKEALRFYKI